MWTYAKIFTFTSSFFLSLLFFLLMYGINFSVFLLFLFLFFFLFLFPSYLRYHSLSLRSTFVKQTWYFKRFNNFLSTDKISLYSFYLVSMCYLCYLGAFFAFSILFAMLFLIQSVVGCEKCSSRFGLVHLWQIYAIQNNTNAKYIFAAFFSKFPKLGRRYATRLKKNK